MGKNYLILVLPFVVLMFIGLAIYSFIAEDWSLWLSIYFILISLVGAFTAYQSTVIQSSFIWEVGELEESELNELAIAVVKDFLFYFLVHGVIFSVVFLLIYWVNNLFVN